MGLVRKLSIEKFTVDEFTIDSTELAQKFVTLSRQPNERGQVAVDVQGGTSQKEIVDFQLIGNTINWAGLGLDVQIGIGDYLRVTYT
jgi:hypothetical protein